MILVIFPFPHCLEDFQHQDFADPKNNDKNPKEEDPNKLPTIWNTFKSGKRKNKNGNKGHRNLVLNKDVKIEKKSGGKVPHSISPGDEIIIKNPGKKKTFRHLGRRPSYHSHRGQDRSYASRRPEGTAGSSYASRLPEGTEDRHHLSEYGTGYPGSRLPEYGTGYPGGSDFHEELPTYWVNEGDETGPNRPGCRRCPAGAGESGLFHFFKFLFCFIFLLTYIM